MNAIPRVLWLNVSYSSADGWTAELHRTPSCDDEQPVRTWTGLRTAEEAERAAMRWAAHHRYGIGGQGEYRLPF